MLTIITKPWIRMANRSLNSKESNNIQQEYDTYRTEIWSWTKYIFYGHALNNGTSVINVSPA